MILLLSLWAIVLASASSSSQHHTRRPELPSGGDPITSFQVIYPVAGAIETLPLEFRAEIGINAIAAYKSYSVDKFLCVELNGSRKKCSPMTNPSIIFRELPNGQYSAQAFITDTNGNVRSHQTSDTRFSIVRKEVFAASTAERSREAKELGLLEWAMQRRSESEKIEETPVGINQEDVAPTMNASDVFLVIGVKTAVVKNFDLRQAIRETWASVNTLPVDVKVFFIGCAPDLTEVHDDDERQQTRYAINLEKQTYGDLLTDELRCEDTYADLPNKVKEFLRFATPQFARTPFFMIADDDIYLRAGELVDELRDVDRSQRLYIGQVWDKLLGRSQTPVRDTAARYYISEDFYPLHTYPAFAFGPHYLLSMDCARFIGKNSGRLRGLGAIDDVSIALWLMTMQVYVKHTAAFSNLRLGACKNDLISLADLSPYGIRSIHSNLFQKRNMCFGFDRALWQMDTIM
ncbi:hypothetical protein PI124_g3588 [Phytophthora idaei]|nr:hypothetical protein PI125_g3134 [Phytophthora idaei]KAG3171910.1 hypothetical protein PI126_g1632 [Phytophthora idaei]KAG3251822.1 hypothetical protein PI124_g3588 [Phytophthora idaei]